MEKINNKNELMVIVGGFNITGTIVNAITGAGKFVFSLGQAFGSAIRRISSKSVCQI